MVDYRIALVRARMRFIRTERCVRVVYCSDCIIIIFIIYFGLCNTVLTGGTTRRCTCTNAAPLGDVAGHTCPPVKCAAVSYFRPRGYCTSFDEPANRTFQTRIFRDRRFSFAEHQAQKSRVFAGVFRFQRTACRRLTR